ncbi:MAG: glycosyltransferase family 39 protein [Bacteroidales bacterium]|nr:glycosyltransferase family 39 protein [Bacteroidales bacterium]
MKKKKPPPKKVIRQKTTESLKKESAYKKYIPYIILVAILILATIIRTNFLSIPFERDEGAYCYLGQCVLDGKIPYLDFYEMKLPGLFYAYAAILWIFGDTIEQIHIAFIFVNLITIVFLFFIGRKLFSNTIALIIAASFAILSMSPHANGFTVQAEHLMMMFVCGGLLLLIHAINSNKAIYFFIAGILLCFSLMIKQTGLFFILFGGIAILSYYLINKPTNLKRGIINSLIYSAGVFISFAVFMIIIWAYGAFEEMFYWIFERASSYVSKHSFEAGLELFRNIFIKLAHQFEIFWVLALSGIILVFIVKINNYKKFVLLSFAFLSFLTIIPGFRFFGHYWIQTIPVISVLIGISIMFLIQLLSKVVKINVSKVIICAAFTIFMISHLNTHKNYYFNPDYTAVLRAVYGMNPFPESKVIGDFIKDNTSEGDKIIVLGSEPQVLIYSGRRSASKHIFIPFLMSDTLLFPESKKLQQEFIDDIIREKPKYMVVFRHGYSFMTSPNASFMVLSLFNDIASRDYNHVGYIDMISDFDTKYIWFDDLNQYEPTGLYSIVVFERKE